MKRGGKILSSVAVVALTACGAQPQLQIRSTPASPSMVERPVPIRIAEGHAQFALGNVALALESFRKAWREDPASADALTGMAACYDRMGRFDLSRRHYEMALALAPGDTQLLAALAVSLQHQGEHEEAAAVRQEIALRLAAAKAAQPQEAIELPAQAVAAPAAPEVAPAPQPMPTQLAEAVQPRRPAPAVEPAKPEPVAPQPAAPPEPAQVAQPPEAEAQPVAEAEVGPSVTIKLPPPRPAVAPAVQVQAAVAPAPALAPAPEPAPQQPPQPVRAVDATPPQRSGPRLERLSMGVVALVTSDGPRWSSETVARTAQSTTVRFVPLREASASTTKVKVLNAARVDRLAARTRSWLTSRGWAPMEIGDAPKPRSQSLIVYPAGQRALAQTLSNQFGFAMEERADAKFVTMLLGRDAARLEELRTTSA